MFVADVTDISVNTGSRVEIFTIFNCKVSNISVKVTFGLRYYPFKVFWYLECFKSLTHVTFVYQSFPPYRLFHPTPTYIDQEPKRVQMKLVLYQYA